MMMGLFYKTLGKSMASGGRERAELQAGTTNRSTRARVTARQEEDDVARPGQTMQSGQEAGSILRETGCPRLLGAHFGCCVENGSCDPYVPAAHMSNYQ